jgi:uncharacterized membrane protein YphA (DoxX/SURF4 family)
MSRFIAYIRSAAAGYEPVVAAQVVAAVFSLLAGLGIAVADWSDKADAVLAFVGVVAPLIAGAYSRSKVSPVHNIGG